MVRGDLCIGLITNGYIEPLLFNIIVLTYSMPLFAEEEGYKVAKLGVKCRKIE
jgi:hypothetical protein